MASHAERSTSSASRLVTAKTAAQQIGIPYRTLRLFVHRGELAVVKVGRALYFSRAELDRWIDSRTERAVGQ